MVFIMNHRLPWYDPPTNIDLSYNETLISFRWHTFLLGGKANMQDAAIALFNDVLRKKKENYILIYCCVEINKSTLDINLKDDSGENITKLLPEVFPKFKDLKTEYDKLKPLMVFL